MADVEQADGVAGRVVLADRARVGHRHRPAREFSEAGPQFAVAVLPRSLQQVVTHVGQINPPVAPLLPTEPNPRSLRSCPPNQSPGRSAPAHRINPPVASLLPTETPIPTG